MNEIDKGALAEARNRLLRAAHEAGYDPGNKELDAELKRFTPVEWGILLGGGSVPGFFGTKVFLPTVVFAWLVNLYRAELKEIRERSAPAPYFTLTWLPWRARRYLRGANRLIAKYCVEAEEKRTERDLAHRRIERIVKYHREVAREVRELLPEGEGDA